MARNNGTFRYTALPLEATRDEATGFYTDDDAPVWVKGCECQVEKFIPAKQRLGTDGQMYSYTFDVFLPSISRKTKCSTFAKHFVPKSHLLTQFKM